MQAARISLRLSLPGDHRMRRVLLAYLLCDLIEFATWMAVVLVAYSRGGATAVGVASVAMLRPCSSDTCWQGSSLTSWVPGSSCLAVGPWGWWRPC